MTRLLSLCVAALAFMLAAAPAQAASVKGRWAGTVEITDDPVPARVGEDGEVIRGEPGQD